VPALPIADIPGLEDAGAALARVYRQMGAAGGGGGQLLGLRIDHVLHAIMGTPITEFRYSPRRTQSTLEQPLIALCEVVYADVLLPLLDTAVVCRSELGYVDEKVAGIVAQLVTLRSHHDFIEQHILEILGVLQTVYETMRQCQPEQSIAFHVKHPDYSRAVKHALRDEVTLELCATLWKLSTELLEMQLDIRQHGAPSPPATQWASPQRRMYVPPTEVPPPNESVPGAPPAAAEDGAARYRTSGYATFEEDPWDLLHANRLRSRFCGPGGKNSHAAHLEHGRRGRPPPIYRAQPTTMSAGRPIGWTPAPAVGLVHSAHHPREDERVAEPRWTVAQLNKLLRAQQRQSTAGPAAWGDGGALALRHVTGRNRTMLLAMIRAQSVSRAATPAPPWHRMPRSSPSTSPRPPPPRPSSEAQSPGSRRAATARTTRPQSATRAPLGSPLNVKIDKREVFTR